MSEVMTHSLEAVQPSRTFKDVEDKLTILSTVVLQEAAATGLLSEAQELDSVIEDYKAQNQELKDLQIFKTRLEEAIVQRTNEIAALKPLADEAQTGMNELFERINFMPDSKLLALAEAAQQARARAVPLMPAQPPRVIAPDYSAQLHKPADEQVSGREQAEVESHDDCDKPVRDEFFSPRGPAWAAMGGLTKSLINSRKRL